MTFTKPEESDLSHERRIKRAKKVLKLDPFRDYCSAEITQQWRHLVKSSHTDTGGDGGDMQALKTARDILLTDIGD